MRQCSKENPETFSVPCNRTHSVTISGAPDRTTEDTVPGNVDTKCKECGGFQLLRCKTITTRVDKDNYPD